MEPTITINIVCTPEQVADVQARVSALQAGLYRLGVAFSVSTHHDPPLRPTMTVDEAQRDPQAFLGRPRRDRALGPLLSRVGGAPALTDAAGGRAHDPLDAPR